jgi:acyl carrier protein
MRTSVATVENILRKELLVPVRHLQLNQVLTKSAGLSSFEWNVLLYYLEEKYHVQLNSISSNATVQDILNQVQTSQK